jgi:hypothetical protein
MLKLAASVAVARAVARGEALAATPAASAPRFFTPHELRLLDAIAETILPADAHSPGAHAAGVAAYVDAELAEKGDAIPEWAEERKAARAHLAALDALSREMNGGKGFLEAGADARTGVLKKASANEASPQSPAEKAFKWAKVQTVDAYYSSKIGIHQEMEYKGNVAILEFVGEEPT